MKDFLRSFIHVTLTSVGTFAVIFLLYFLKTVLIDKSSILKLFTHDFILISSIALVLVILVYIVPMSLYYASMIHVVSISINGNGDILNRKQIIENYIKEKIKKCSVRKEDAQGVVYYMQKQRYAQWLNNPISIETREDSILINTPAVCLHIFKKMQKELELL